jgi:gliding motility-associated protein GldL
MKAKTVGFREKFYTYYSPIITNFGASVVIIGALFKIMHWKGADVMLIAGLGTEALLFALFAFAPIHHEPEWSRVYPQLADDYDGEELSTSTEVGYSNGVSKKLDTMLAEANINDDLIARLGTGMRNLSESVSKMTDLSNVTVASNEYAKNVQEASKSLVEMNKSYASTVAAMSEMSNAAVDAKQYHMQIQTVTKNLGALNAVYEMELQDANNHLKAMNKFYGNLSTAMENMSDASRDTQQFKTELSKLTNNLSSLNNVYGSMLTAMKG